MAVTEELQTEEAAGLAIAGPSHRDPVRAGVVRLVIVGFRGNGDGVEPGAHRLVVAQAGARGRHVKDFDDLGSEAPRVLATAAHRVLPRNPSLLVRSGP